MSETLATGITIDPEICHRKPTIRGLRYPVDSMPELMASGMSTENLLPTILIWKKKIF